MSEFFAMGGYAFYVWGSWSVSLFVLVYIAARPLMGHKKLSQKIQQKMVREKRLKENQ